MPRPLQAVGQLGARPGGDAEAPGQLDRPGRLLRLHHVGHGGVVERAQPQASGQVAVEVGLGALQVPQRPRHLRGLDLAPFARSHEVVVWRSLRHGGIIRRLLAPYRSDMASEGHVDNRETTRTAAASSRCGRCCSCCAPPWPWWWPGTPPWRSPCPTSPRPPVPTSPSSRGSSTPTRWPSPPCCSPPGSPPTGSGEGPCSWSRAARSSPPPAWPRPSPRTPPWLIALRALAGVGAAAVFPVTLSALVDAYPAERRGFAVAVWSGRQRGRCGAGHPGRRGAARGVLVGQRPARLRGRRPGAAARRRRPRGPEPRPRPCRSTRSGALLGRGRAHRPGLRGHRGPPGGWAIGGGPGRPRAGRRRPRRASSSTSCARRRRRWTSACSPAEAWPPARCWCRLQFFASLGLFVLAPQYLQVVRGYSPLESAAALLVIPVGVGAGTGARRPADDPVGARLPGAVGPGGDGRRLRRPRLPWSTPTDAALGQLAPRRSAAVRARVRARRHPGHRPHPRRAARGPALGGQRRQRHHPRGRRRPRHRRALQRPDQRSTATTSPGPSPGCRRAARQPPLDGAGAALGVADGLRAGRRRGLADAARAAFAAGLSTALWVGAAVLAVAAVVCGALAPGRSGPTDTPPGTGAVPRTLARDPRGGQPGQVTVDQGVAERALPGRWRGAAARRRAAAARVRDLLRGGAEELAPVRPGGERRECRSTAATAGRRPRCPGPR